MNLGLPSQWNGQGTWNILKTWLLEHLERPLPIAEITGAKTIASEIPATVISFKVPSDGVWLIGIVCDVEQNAAGYGVIDIAENTRAITQSVVNEPIGDRIPVNVSIPLFLEKGKEVKILSYTLGAAKIVLQSAVIWGVKLGGLQ